MKGEEGVLGFLYHANLSSMPAAKAPSDLPQSKVFRGIGVASLHTTLLDSREDVHLLFKSSPFGTQSHGHNPHNSFQLNAYGEALLTTCVYRDLHGSKFHYEWAHSTVAHNAVLVNGEGQIKHTPAPHGRIEDFQLSPKFDYLAGDTTAAYGNRLQRYRRHVAFVKSDPDHPVIVLYDDLSAREPSTFQFMLHALKPFTVDERTGQLSVEQARAGVEVRYLAPVPLSFRQWDGYQPKPDREVPNQWHVEAGTREKRKDCGVLTVLIPFRSGHREDWKAERVESDSAIGVRVIRGDKVILVAFRKEGTKGEAKLEGIPFKESVLIRL
ncbi:MAG: heparinase II/III family protein [Verrucomicrobia bacterium]|nr:heparinase II/III family protein [Verrucomicrobiota bacterium]